MANLSWIHVKSSCEGELPALPLKFEPGTDCKTFSSSVRPFNSLYCCFVNTSRLWLEFWHCWIPRGKDIRANFGAILVRDVLHDPVIFDWSWIARSVYLILWAWKHPFSWRRTLKKKQLAWLTVTQMALCIPGIIKSRSSNKIPPKVCKNKISFQMLVRPWAGDLTNLSLGQFVFFLEEEDYTPLWGIISSFSVTWCRSMVSFNRCRSSWTLIYKFIVQLVDLSPTPYWKQKLYTISSYHHYQRRESNRFLNTLWLKALLGVPLLL